MINGNFISIVGGAGHVGAPLGLALSSKGYNVILIDKNKENIKKINRLSWSWKTAIFQFFFELQRLKKRKKVSFNNCAM